MQDIRGRLARRYPAAVRATDPAWDTFLGSLRRTGQVDWQTANTMREASNTLTGQIQREASARNAWASLLLRLGVAGLLVALAAAGLLLLGLRAVENERQTAEKQLQQERDFQSALLESLQAGIVACDAGGTLTLFNRAAREFHGLAEEPLPPERWAERFSLFGPDGATPLDTQDVPLLRAFRGEGVRDSEMVIAPQDLPSRTVLASGQAICSADGTKLGAVVAMHDVTARRRIEQELSRLASIVQSSEEAILAGDFRRHSCQLECRSGEALRLLGRGSGGAARFRAGSRRRAEHCGVGDPATRARRVCYPLWKWCDSTEVALFLILP